MIVVKEMGDPMAPQGNESIPDLRPRWKLPKVPVHGVHLVGAAYLCAIGLFVGGGFGGWGAFCIVPGFWFLVIGTAWSVIDTIFRRRRPKGLVGVVAGGIMLIVLWLILRH
jgi:hypothetical protein